MAVFWQPVDNLDRSALSGLACAPQEGDAPVAQRIRAPDYGLIRGRPRAVCLRQILRWPRNTPLASAKPLTRSGRGVKIENKMWSARL